MKCDNTSSVLSEIRVSAIVYAGSGNSKSLVSDILLFPAHDESVPVNALLSHDAITMYLIQII